MSRKRWRAVKEIRIADVAQLAGVSTATVSRVLSDPDKVRQKTHDLVMEAVKRSGYIPNSTAQKLRTRRTMNVLVGAWCDTEHHASVVSALARAGKQVMDETRTMQALTPKSARGDAAAE